MSETKFNNNLDVSGNINMSGNLVATQTWANSQFSGASIGSIDTLSDVDTTTNAPSNGQVLKWDGSNWIPQNDAAGSSGYRSDGATVILLAWTDEFIRLGAFANNYSDVYNFNLKEKTVAWTSNKSGPLMGKAAVYLSSCR